MQRVATVAEIANILKNLDWDAFLAARAAADRAKKLQQEQPWIYDIIRVLVHRPNGLNIQQIYREVHAVRNPNLPKPKDFEATIRSAIYGYTSQSTKWSGNSLTDIFYSPRRGTWAVYPDRAYRWIIDQNLNPV